MDDLRYELYVGAQPEKVWQTLISPEGTKAILFGCILKSTFEIGAPYEYVGPGDDGDETVHVYGKILAFEPNRLMSYTEHPENTKQSWPMILSNIKTYTETGKTLDFGW